MNTQTSPPSLTQVRRPLTPELEKDSRSTYFHRQFLGGLGLVLPFLLVVIAVIRPTEGLPPGQLLGSVSAYYYTGGTAAFAGVLFVMAVYLFTYQGYKNLYQLRDRLAALVAGAAALLVAFFPTAAPSPLPPLSWWSGPIGVVHYIGAALLFSSFIFFSLFLFPKTDPQRSEPLPPDKLMRNRVYYLCGFAMIACMAWVILNEVNHLSIFWPETLALEFFAVSWLVKGRADWTAVAAGERIFHYGRHPGELVERVKSSMRSK